MDADGTLAIAMPLIIAFQRVGCVKVAVSPAVNEASHAGLTPCTLHRCRKFEICHLAGHRDRRNMTQRDKKGSTQPLLTVPTVPGESRFQFTVEPSRATGANL